MVERVDSYLADADKRQQVAAEGYRQITTGQHTYDDQMKQVVAAIEAL
jgi:spore maturation protein CgeB